MKVKGESEVDQSHPTLSDPMDCSLPGSSVHDILQAGILEWVAMPSSRDLPDPGIEPGLLHCRQSLYRLSHRGSPFMASGLTFKPLIHSELILVCG